MKGNQRYTEEFKIAAVKQVLDRGRKVSDVAKGIGVSGHSLYAWVKRYGGDPAERVKRQGAEHELKQLKAELRRVTEERDILKKAAAYFAKESG